MNGNHLTLSLTHSKHTTNSDEFPVTDSPFSKFLSLSVLPLNQPSNFLEKQIIVSDGFL